MERCQQQNSSFRLVQYRLSRSIIIINIIMSVEAKKESIRAALQELENPDCSLSANAAMETLKQAVGHDFDDTHGFIGDFVGDDDFKEEIFSARVVHVVMDVAKDKAKYPELFYHHACGLLHSLCLDSIERSTAFVAHGGVEFLLEALEASSSDEFLLISCFGLHWGVIGGLSKKESASFAGKTLGKLLDVVELHSKTCDADFYTFSCHSVGICFRPGLEFDYYDEIQDLFQRTISYVWFGITKHKYDEDAQNTGRSLLCHLAGKENAKKMIDHSEMHHCEDEECTGCA
jgi:hypothetical protein